MPRELLLETESSAEEVEAALKAAAVAEDGVFVLTDAKGGKVLVPADKIAYLEFGGSEAAPGRLQQPLSAPGLRPSQSARPSAAIRAA